MSITVENLEFFFLILVRMSTFIFIAPFFGMTNIPVKVKAGLSIFLSILVFNIIGYTELEYVGTIGYAGLVIKEGITGFLIGFGASICTTILNFSGQLIDMEIGFSMVNVLDPVTRIQSTVTGNLYNYFVMLVFISTDFHYFLLTAIRDTYKLIPIGGAIMRPSLYMNMLKFLGDYFIIGFRIVLPIFATILLVNIVLAILAKVAPQMNMFVIGFQLKIFIGLLVLVFIINMIPSVADMIFNEMTEMIKGFIKGIT